MYPVLLRAGSTVPATTVVSFTVTSKDVRYANASVLRNFTFVNKASILAVKGTAPLFVGVQYTNKSEGVTLCSVFI
jgi:hypothetical protein